MVPLISLKKHQVSNLNSHGISPFYMGDSNSDQQVQDNLVKKGIDIFLNSNQGLAKVI